MDTQSSEASMPRSESHLCFGQLQHQDSSAANSTSFHQTEPAVSSSIDSSSIAINLSSVQTDFAAYSSISSTSPELSTTMSIGAFELFPQLPFGNRIKIWKFSFAARKVKFRSSTDAGQTLSEHPATLFVNRESRQVTKNLYYMFETKDVNGIGTNHTKEEGSYYNRTIYLNPGIDTVSFPFADLFEDSNKSRMWLNYMGEGMSGEGGLIAIRALELSHVTFGTDLHEGQLNRRRNTGDTSESGPDLLRLFSGLKTLYLEGSADWDYGEMMDEDRTSVTDVVEDFFGSFFLYPEVVLREIVLMDQDNVQI